MRLKDYDYSQSGAYFLTICADGRRMLFGNIVGAIHESPEIRLTEYGKIVKQIIEELPFRFDVRIDHYAIMPNHIHLLVVIEQPNTMRAIHESPLRGRSVIDKLVGYLKMNASKAIHRINASEKVWQRSYYDHVVRNERDYLEIWEYIENNPARWHEDRFCCERPDMSF